MRLNLRAKGVVVVMGLIAASAPFAAADSVVIGGSGLLTTAGANQLAGDLGEGDLVLTNIFSHVAGDGKTATDFHAAADGKGRTFAVYHLVGVGTAPSDQIIGGYDPQSWNSSGSYVFAGDAERTAFLFNLTAHTLLTEKLGTLDSGLGQYQTYDNPAYGPTFGGGHDLYTDFTLDSGYANQASYGLAGVSGTNVLATSISSNAAYDSIDIFTIQDATVSTPLPGAAIGGMVLLGGVGAGRIRRARRAAR